MHADSKQIIKNMAAGQVQMYHMLDGLVQLCIPARWLGTNIGA